MNRKTINAVAKIRGQKTVLVEFNGDSFWILVDSLPCSVEYIAQGLGSDAYAHWELAEVLTFDHTGRLMRPEEEGFWNDLNPIRFFTVPKKAKTMCGICGLALHIWRFGWKHSSGGRVKRRCCDSPVPVKLKKS